MLNLMGLIVLIHLKPILPIAYFSKPHLEVHPSLPSAQFDLLGADTQEPYTAHCWYPKNFMTPAGCFCSRTLLAILSQRNS